MPQGRCFGLQRCSETPRESFLSSLQRSLLVLGWECPARKIRRCSVRKQGILDKLADPGFAAKDQYSIWHELVHWNDCVIFVVIWEINLVWAFKDSESSFKLPLTSIFFLSVHNFFIIVTFQWADLDVVKVDFSQTAIIVVNSLQGFLHIGGVWRFFREDLERIWFHNAWRR